MGFTKMTDSSAQDPCMKTLTVKPALISAQKQPI